MKKGRGIYKTILKVDIVQLVEQLYVAQLVPCSNQGILRIDWAILCGK